jgi:hypothetical protein
MGARTVRSVQPQVTSSDSKAGPDSNSAINLRPAGVLLLIWKATSRRCHNAATTAWAWPTSITGPGRPDVPSIRAAGRGSLAGVGWSVGTWYQPGAERVSGPPLTLLGAGLTVCGPVGPAAPTKANTADTRAAARWLRWPLMFAAPGLPGANKACRAQDRGAYRVVVIAPLPS